MLEGGVAIKKNSDHEAASIAAKRDLHTFEPLSAHGYWAVALENLILMALSRSYELA